MCARWLDTKVLENRAQLRTAQHLLSRGTGKSSRGKSFIPKVIMQSREAKSSRAELRDAARISLREGRNFLFSFVPSPSVHGSKVRAQFTANPSRCRTGSPTTRVFCSTPPPASDPRHGHVVFPVSKLGDSSTFSLSQRYLRVFSGGCEKFCDTTPDLELGVLSLFSCDMRD